MIGWAATAARIVSRSSASSTSGAAGTVVGDQSTAVLWCHQDSPSSHSWAQHGCVDGAAEHGHRLDVGDQATGQVRRADGSARQVALPGQVQLGVKGALARVEDPHRQALGLGALEAGARRRAERCGADQSAVAQLAELRLDQVDAGLLHEGHAEQRLVGAVEDATHGD